MALFQNAGDSIECSACSITVRKITNKPVLVNLQKIDGNFIRVFKYKTNISNIVAITQELNPKVAIISALSNLNLTDTLKAETVEIFTERKVNLEVQSNFSHVHSIQTNNVRAFTYATIIAPFRFILQRALGNN